MGRPGDSGTQEQGPGDSRPDHDPARRAEDDHDLLTFGEAGARLHIEVRAMRERVRVLADATPVDDATLAVTCSIGRSWAVPITVTSAIRGHACKWPSTVCG